MSESEEDQTPKAGSVVVVPKKLHRVNPRILPTSIELVSTDTRKFSPRRGGITTTFWENPISQGIFSETYTTAYIQGMEKGDLNPNYYGQYVVEDVIYLIRSIENLNYLAIKCAKPDPPLFEFFTEKAYSYTKYTLDMAKAWHIVDDDGLEAGPSVTDYIRLQRILAFSDLPVGYSIAAMIPCERMWPELALKMKAGTSATSIYSSWADENAKYDIPGSLAKKLDALAEFGGLDPARLLEIYLLAMQCERNFFLAGGKQEYPSITIPQWILHLEEKAEEKFIAFTKRREF